MAAAKNTSGRQPRRGQRMTRVLWFITSSSAAGPRLRLVAGAPERELRSPWAAPVTMVHSAAANPLLAGSR
jgi:hypothetical protein